MKLHQGVWLPDGETHLTAWMDRAGEIVDGKGTYQIKKLRTAVSFCKQFRTAVDVGGHCGLWSMQLVKQFEMVHAFEPVEAHRDCFRLNVPMNKGAWQLHECALGEKEDLISIHTAETSSGDSWVKGPGKIPMHRLDDFALGNVDFIKLDTEGHELFILRGGAEMLKANKPVVIVEQKPGHAQRFGVGDQDAVPYLKSLGARVVRELSGDFVMVWP
jgi:FkbM family methyltransferase